MIGDRIHDIQAAHANHVRCLAAGWGYGASEECALADAVAQTPAEVLDLLLKGSSEAQADGKATSLPK
jgi:phosphoglycolate phosphatase-like HAD superfamily hydrolase